jgi:hypothetical protein
VTCCGLQLAALDPTTNTLRWASPPGKAYCCTGLAIVPGQVRIKGHSALTLTNADIAHHLLHSSLRSQGLLVAAGAVSQQVCVYRLSDGACLTGEKAWKQQGFHWLANVHLSVSLLVAAAMTCPTQHIYMAIDPAGGTIFAGE